MKSPEELKRAIPDRPGYYATIYGQIIGKKGEPLKGCPNASDYLRVPIRINGKTKMETIHSLVLLAFKGPKPEGMSAAHLDSNRYNNAPDNLIWCPFLENISHRKTNGTNPEGEKHPCHKLTEKQVLEIRRDYRHGLSRPLAEKYGVSRSNIIVIAKGKSWKHL